MASSSTATPVEQQIKFLERKIEGVEQEIKLFEELSRTEQDAEEKRYLRKKEEDLREEKKRKEVPLLRNVGAGDGKSKETAFEQNAISTALGSLLPSTVGSDPRDTVLEVLRTHTQTLTQTLTDTLAQTLTNTLAQTLLRRLDTLGLEVSATRSASNINADDFELVLKALKIYGPIPEDINGVPLEEDAHVLDSLLGNETFWDERYEEQQRERYCAEVESWVKGRRRIKWVNSNRETLRRRFEGLHFVLSSKNDLVAVSKLFGKLFGQGALLGVELKRKKLTAKSLRQAVVEYLLWADASCFPFVQVVTDMQKGGVAYYCKRIDTVKGIELRQVVLKNMKEVQEFVSRIGKNFPDEMMAQAG